MSETPDYDVVRILKALPHRCMVQLMFGEMDERERGRDTSATYMARSRA